MARLHYWAPVALAAVVALAAGCSTSGTSPTLLPAQPPTASAPTTPAQPAAFSGRLLVATAEANRVAALDLGQRQVLSSAEVGPSLHGVSMLPGGKLAVVTSQTPNSTIRVIDPATLAVKNEINTEYSTHHTWTDPKGRYVYVTAMPDQLLVIGNDGRLAKQITVGKGAYAVAPSGDGSRVYVTLQGANAVAVVNADTLTLEKTIPVPGGVNHIAVSPEGNRVYTTLVTGQAVAEVDVVAGKVTRTFPIGAPGHGVGITADGKWVYATSLEGNLIVQIEVATGNVKKLPTPGMPNHVTLTPDKRFMFVTVTESKQIQAFDVATGQLAATFDVGLPPHEFAFVDAAPAPATAAVTAPAPATVAAKAPAAAAAASAPGTPAPVAAFGVLARAIVDSSTTPPGWTLMTPDGDAVTWLPTPGELRIAVDADAFTGAGLKLNALSANGWVAKPAPLDAHGHEVGSASLMRVESLGKALPVGRDPVADLLALLDLKPGALMAGQSARFGAGDGFAWAGDRLRLELAADPLQAAGLDPAKTKGWKLVAAANGRPALLTKEVAFK